MIESPTVPTVGVGEATVTGMSRLLRELGVDEAEFFRRCNASFKLAVQFNNWAVDAANRPISFYHPFNFPPALSGVAPVHHFNKFGRHEGGGDLTDCMVTNQALVEANKGPRKLGGQNYECEISYAYHLDASLFGRFLRDVAIAQGVEHIQDDVTEVVLDDKGFVSALRLEQGGLFPVELVVDCTGFKGLIMQQALGEPFEPVGGSLLCDRAIPVQIPHRDVTGVQACTRSTGLGAGWVWRVPLFSRLGTGYVFSSAFRSDDEARTEFFQHLRAIGDLPPDAPDPETRTIHMKVGRVRRAWVKNCVAIGLAGGFVEPLESTAIYMIEMAARWLVSYLPDREMNPVFAGRYNKLIGTLYDEVYDFIISHYHTGNRPDPFWLAARNDIAVPDSLRENLELWRHILPNVTDTPQNKLFQHWNYIYTLWPKGFFRNAHFPLEGSVSRQDWQAFGQQNMARRQELLAALPNHYELLTEIRGDMPAAEAPVNLPPELIRRTQMRPTIPLP